MTPAGPPPVLPVAGARVSSSTSTLALHWPVAAVGGVIAAVTLLGAIAGAIAPQLGPATAPHPTLHGTPSEAAAIFAHNTQTLIVPLLLCAGRWHTGRLTRHVADVVVGVLVIVNAALVGVALGRYPTALPAYLPHLPLEYAALAIASSAWLTRRLPADAAHGVPGVMRCTLLTVIVTAAAAAVETYAVPHKG